jgi:glycosyltransferase involved in cell wall biosynthesis
MLRLSHVITGLGVGGAETMLVKLLGAMDRRRFEPHVISLSSDLALAPHIRDLGIEIDVLDSKPYFSNAFSSISSLTQALRKTRPDVVQTWLYHADLSGGIAAKRLGIPAVWNVQSSTLDPAAVSRSTLRVVRYCAWSSRFIPRAIVSCSHAAVHVHEQIGYRGRFHVVANGADLEAFKPDAKARRAIRAELGLDDSVPLIGMIARLHPQKDHPNFLAAASQLVRTHPHVRFLLCGLDLQPANEELTASIDALQLQGHVLRMGLRGDVPRVLNALDIHTLSSSFGEGFSNVIGEAMATGLPCVVTDVGDSALIVGDTGVSVPSRDSAALANGWRALLDLPAGELARLGARARERVAKEFSLAASVMRYEALYEEVAAQAARR